MMLAAELAGSAMRNPLRRRRIPVKQVMPAIAKRRM
jgi:hypothetical protein